ncbi:four helix bundle protein [Candidatus Gottesmanbacteria bacterium]|nr:four helix bundle protein [Candidatus Gottesmanbacteria bacterium]
MNIAYGSGAELETQLYIAKLIDYLNENDYKLLTEKLTEIMKMLNGLIYKLKPRT